MMDKKNTNTQKLAFFEKPNKAKSKKKTKTFHILKAEYIEAGQWNKLIHLLRTEYKKANLSARSRAKKVNLYLEKGIALAKKNDVLNSIICHCDLLAIDGEHSAALRNLAVLLRLHGDRTGALDFANRYLGKHPSCAEGHNTVGTIYSDIGDTISAINSFKKAIKFNPNFAAANINLAGQYHIIADIDNSFLFSAKAVSLEPDNLAIWLDHLTQLRRVCDFDRIDRIDWWKLVEQVTLDSVCCSFLQLLVLAETESDQHLLNKSIQQWASRLEKRICSKEQVFEIQKERSNSPIRVGFVSGDFRDHSVARFIWPLFENNKQEEILLHCYSTHHSNDAWSQRFQKSAFRFLDISQISDFSAKEQIRNDNLDIVFDLTGFTKGNRMALFAHRLAPIQVAWLGFPGSTGMNNMDYLFLDKHLSPSQNILNTEERLITPGTSVCFSGLEDIPITQHLPEELRGFITFGSLNNPYKITRKCIERWAKILADTPSSRFLFVRREFESALLRSNLEKEFEKNGIKKDRITFMNNRKVGRHYLDCYNEIDITLDTYPVTGGTTTVDALWMGVPVVSLQGSNIHQRVCSAILNHAGRQEWIAQNNDEFHSIAITLAHDQEKRKEIRVTMRDIMKNSLLCNPQKFAEDFRITLDKLLNNQQTL